MHCIQLIITYSYMTTLSCFIVNIELQNVIIFLFWKWVSKRQKYENDTSLWHGHDFNLFNVENHAGRYRPSSHQEDCCLPHGTYTTNGRHQLFHHRPAASRLKSRKSFMRTVTPLDSSVSNSRLRLWKDSLTHVPASVNMGREVAKSLPAGSGEDWLCWRSLNRLRTGVGRAKTVIRRWGYLDDAQSVDCDCGEPQTMAHLLSCRLLDEACTDDDLATVTERA